MKRFRRVEVSVPLAVMPTAILILSAVFVHLQGGFRDDPDYGPLLNALNVLNFHSPGILEHPGTPVHIVGALVLGLSWLVRAAFVGFPRPDYDILAHPEQYLFYINFVFAFLSASATYYLGLRLQAATDSLSVALAGQASILFAYPVLVMLPHVTQEPLLISLTVFLAAVLVPVIFSRRTFAESKNYGTMVGAIIGLCIATKLIAIPLLLSTLFLRGRNIRFIALGAVPISFLISTWPAHHLYPMMAQYWLEILTHTGHDGNGPEGIFSTAMFLRNLTTLLLPGIGLLVPLVLSFTLALSRAGSRVKSDCDFPRLFFLAGLFLLRRSSS